MTQHYSPHLSKSKQCEDSCQTLVILYLHVSRHGFPSRVQLNGCWTRCPPCAYWIGCIGESGPKWFRSKSGWLCRRPQKNILHLFFDKIYMIKIFAHRIYIVSVKRSIKKIETSNFMASFCFQKTQAIISWH